MNDGDSAIGVCGNDRGCIFTAGNEASGVYGQPVWISIESKTKSAGRHQGIIRKKKIRDFAQGTGGTGFPSSVQLLWHCFALGDPLLFCWEIFSLLR